MIAMRRAKPADAVRRIHIPLTRYFRSGLMGVSMKVYFKIRVKSSLRQIKLSRLLKTGNSLKVALKHACQNAKYA
jgi:hypothetical protein